MLRLGPAPEGKGYFANLMTDLTTTRPLTSKPLQIEITAQFHASKPHQNEHYSFNAATFAEPPAIVSTLWENTWRDMRDASLTTTGKALFPTAAEPGWHTITLLLDVPPQARTLVISPRLQHPRPRRWPHRPLHRRRPRLLGHQRQNPRPLSVLLSLPLS
jgi:hypothetical protein